MFDRLYQRMGLIVKQTGISEEALSKVNIPILVLAGEHDWIKKSHTIKIAALIPFSKIYIIKGAGHLLPSRNSIETNNLIAEFISKLKL